MYLKFLAVAGLLVLVLGMLSSGCGGGTDTGQDATNAVLTATRAVHALGTTATGPTGTVPSYVPGSPPIPGGGISDVNPLSTTWWDFDYVGLNQGVFNDTVQLTDANGANLGNPVVLCSAGHGYPTYPDFTSACNQADCFQVALEANVQGVLVNVAPPSTPVGDLRILTTWSSSDPTAISVSAAGLLCALKPNVCVTITWTITSGDPARLSIAPGASTGTFAACVDSGGVDTATRALWLPEGDVDANLPGMPSGPPRPKVGETFGVTLIVNTGTEGLAASAFRSEYNATAFTDNQTIDTQSIGGSTLPSVGLPIAVNPAADVFATLQSNATRWNDIDAFAQASGIFDLGSQTFTAVSAGTTAFSFFNEELANGAACNIWIGNPCMPYNSTVCPAGPPAGGYLTRAASGMITIDP